MPIFHKIWINPRRGIDDKKNVSVNLTFLTFQVMFCTMHGNKIGFIITSEINQAKLTMSKVFLTKLKETVSVISMQRGKCPIYNSTRLVHLFVCWVQRYVCVNFSKPSQLQIQVYVVLYSLSSAQRTLVKSGIARFA